MGGGVSRLGNPGGGRGLEVQEIQEEGGGQKLLPSVGGVWIFSGITQCQNKIPGLFWFSRTRTNPEYTVINWIWGA